MQFLHDSIIWTVLCVLLSLSMYDVFKFAVKSFWVIHNQIPKRKDLRDHNPTWCEHTNELGDIEREIDELIDDSYLSTDGNTRTIWKLFTFWKK